MLLTIISTMFLVTTVVAQEDNTGLSNGVTCQLNAIIAHATPNQDGSYRLLIEKIDGEAKNAIADHQATLEINSTSLIFKSTEELEDRRFTLTIEQDNGFYYLWSGHLTYQGNKDRAGVVGRGFCKHNWAWPL